MMLRSSLLMSTALAALLLQTACTPVGLAAGAGATAGVAVMSDGGVHGAVSDLEIKASINDLWFRSNVDIFRKLNLTVDQGRVLITGVVQNPEHRVEAVRLAWQPRGVKQVINEIRVANSDGVPGYVRDTWITTQLRTKMTLDRDVQSINYSIDTVQGIVYLMGTARDQNELNRATEIARSISNVRQVVSYVKLRGEPILTTTPGAQATGTGAAAAPVATYPQATNAGSGGGYGGASSPATGTAPAPDAVTATPLNP